MELPIKKKNQQKDVKFLKKLCDEVAEVHFKSYECHIAKTTVIEIGQSYKHTYVKLDSQTLRAHWYDICQGEVRKTQY